MHTAVECLRGYSEGYDMAGHVSGHGSGEDQPGIRPGFARQLQGGQQNKTMKATK